MRRRNDAFCLQWGLVAEDKRMKSLRDGNSGCEYYTFFAFPWENKEVKYSSLLLLFVSVIRTSQHLKQVHSSLRSTVLTFPSNRIRLLAATSVSCDLQMRLERGKPPSLKLNANAERILNLYVNLCSVVEYFFNVFWRRYHATTAKALRASFHICTYFVSACINNNSASAVWSICLRRFSLPDRQTAQTSFVSSQEQKLYCG